MTPTRDPRGKTRDPSSCWYFAYGSNMQSATLRGRRGIEYRCALAGRVRGWRLVFDKPPLMPSGTGFANVVAEDAGEVLGVLYQISHADMAHIDLTEGVMIGNYRRIIVTVEPLHPAPVEPIQAFTLTSDRRKQGLQPSTRYMGLLIEGALEHNLPISYVERLRAVSTREETAAELELRSFVDEALRRR